MTLPAMLTTKPSCATNRAGLAAAYGAISSVTGLDRLFQGFGAPPLVHWALAGAAADYQCRGGPVFDQDYAMNMAYGAGGGLAVSFLLGR